MTINPFPGTDETSRIGFVPPYARKLHGTNKSAARRRHAALIKVLINQGAKSQVATVTPGKIGGNRPTSHPYTSEMEFVAEQNEIQEPITEDEVQARKDLQTIFGFADDSSSVGNNNSPIPNSLWNALVGERHLYCHQAKAIEAALSNTHTSVCTGTGSGKSLCFLLPILAAAYNENATSLLMFPTKALAQDQLSKLQTILRTDHLLSKRIRPATLDGDTPHSARGDISNF